MFSGDRGGLIKSIFIVIAANKNEENYDACEFLGQSFT